jgi:hypothetical protein
MRDYIIECEKTETIIKSSNIEQSKNYQKYFLRGDQKYFAGDHTNKLKLGSKLVFAIKKFTQNYSNKIFVLITLNLTSKDD